MRGRRVLSRDWIRMATSAHARINDPEVDDYGYGWWLKTYQLPGRRLRTIYAAGNGGQRVVVFRDLGTVVTFTAGNYNSPAARALIEDIIPRFLLPAMLGDRGGDKASSHAGPLRSRAVRGTVGAEAR